MLKKLRDFFSYKKNKRKSISSLYKLVMFFSAVLSTYVALSSKMENKAEAVMHPNLKSYMVADSTDNSSGIKIKNTGLGPLLIKNIEIYKRNEIKSIKNTSSALRDAFNLSYREFSLDLIHPKDALQQGEERWLVKSKLNSTPSSKKVLQLANNIGIVTCYCNTKDQCSIKNFGFQVKHKMEC